METLVRDAVPEQQERWLKPLWRVNPLGLLTTELAVASSDATIEARIERDGLGDVINANGLGRGAMDLRRKIFILMGNTYSTTAPSTAIDDPGAARYPGLNVVRPLSVFGYDDAPHGHAEVEFKDVRVPAENIFWRGARFRVFGAPP